MTQSAMHASHSKMKGGGNYGNEKESSEEGRKEARSSKAQGRKEGGKAKGSRIVSKNSPAS